MVHIKTRSQRANAISTVLGSDCPVFATALESTASHILPPAPPSPHPLPSPPTLGSILTKGFFFKLVFPCMELSSVSLHLVHCHLPQTPCPNLFLLAKTFLATLYKTVIASLPRSISIAILLISLSSWAPPTLHKCRSICLWFSEVFLTGKTRRGS